jgi:hypothetical protein
LAKAMPFRLNTRLTDNGTELTARFVMAGDIS